jgi:hypothetical protein
MQKIRPYGDDNQGDMRIKRGEGSSPLIFSILVLNLKASMKPKTILDYWGLIISLILLGLPLLALISNLTK